jgi:hypothetical protein
MKFRIIRKTIEGYQPAYYFQECYFGFWWVTVLWGTDYDHIKGLAENHVARLQQKPPEDKVLWEIKI